MQTLAAYYYKRPLLFTVAFIILGSLLIYREYLVSEVSYLFSAYDGFGQTMPYMIGIADYIKTEGFPRWSFSIGLGSAIPIQYIGSPFLLVPILIGVFFGNAALVQSIVYVQIAKVVLAGLFFFLFLKKFNLHPLACSVSAILYAMSGILITRGVWINYATECVLVALLLFAIELYLRDQKWCLLPFAVCLIITSLGLTYLYLYGILMIFYLALRFAFNNNLHIGFCLKYMARLFGLFILGVLLAGVILLPNIYEMLQSSRFSSTVSEFDMFMFLGNFLNLADEKTYLSEFYRFLSPDILGIYGDYSGTSDLLGGPLFYCGLITLVLMPQTIALSRGKMRVLFCLGFIAMALYLIFPNIQTILNAFIYMKPIFKLSSLWICIFILIALAYSLNKILHGSRLNKTMLFATGGLLIALELGLQPLLAQNEIQTVGFIVLLVLVLIVLYIFLLYGYQVFSKKRLVLSCLISLILIEAVGFAAITTRNSFSLAETMTNNYFLDLKSPDLDSTQEAIDYLQATDAGFYRINRVGQTYCDPLFYGYFASSNYDSYITASYVEFLTETNVGRVNDLPYSITNGILNHPLLQTLTGFKYQIGEYGQVGVDENAPITTDNQANTYLRAQTLPLAFTYESWMSLDEFEQLKDHEKDLVLLQTAVVLKPLTDLPAYESDTSVKSADAKINTASIEYQNIDDVSGDIADSLQITTSSADPYISFQLVPDGSADYYVVSFSVLADSITTTQVFWSTVGQDISGLDFMEGYIINDTETELSFTIHKPNLAQMRIDPGLKPGEYEISNLEIKAYSYGDSYINAVSQRQKGSFTIESFKQNSISGSINTQTDQLLFFSIPYSEGWSATLNGAKVDIQKVNVGFIGIELPPGDHQITLNYQLPGLVLGEAMSVLGILVYLVMVAYSTRKLRENI